MKKVIAVLMGLALAAAFVPVGSFAGENPARVKIITKDYDFRGFDAIDASWVYDIELTQSTRYAVRVEAPDFVEPYLRVEVSGGRLRLGVKSLPVNVQRSMNREEVHVYISMPELSGLQLSGASKLRAKGTFRNRSTGFKLDLSGAVNLTGLQVLARDAEIGCSGASKYNLSGDFDTVEMDLSGASEGTVNMTAKKYFLGTSGASKLNLDTNAETITVNAAGASTLSLTGKADLLEAEGNGNAKINAGTLPVQNAQVNLSGSSSARINATKMLHVDLSGSSQCRYRDNAGLQISRMGISRGSSLTAY